MTARHMALTDSAETFDNNTTTVDYVLAGHPLRRLTTPLLLRARRSFFEQFMAVCRPDADESILDVGVTPDSTLRDSNYLEQWYPYTDRITATSVEDASDLERRYPGLRFVRTDGDRLPFGDGEFDVAFSSAVLEHVGDASRQAQFVRELVRVSQRFFLSTPNRWFPLELHSYLPFVHWLPQPAGQRIMRAVGQEHWATTENLNLLSASRLRQLFPEDVHVFVRRHRVAGLTSNLIAFGRRSDLR
ncbi:MAG TPA: methyltransferase domain-containing protein [Acidimicrobiales bacterium]|nr:methyltransferase domain-containing protein [Acidimicrobiales bacterium]